MRITNQEIDAARNLGEALLRFLVAVSTASRQDTSFSGQTAATPTSRNQTAVRNGRALLTTSAAAKLLGLSRSKIYGLMEAGELPYVKLGKSRRLRLADVQRLIRNNLVGRPELLDDRNLNPGRIEQ